MTIREEKTRIKKWFSDHPDAIYQLVVFGNAVAIFGAGYFWGDMQRAKSTKGWDIVRIDKGVLHDTGNTAIEILYQNGRRQIFEMAPGESIP